MLGAWSVVQFLKHQGREACKRVVCVRGVGGVGTRPWWLALLACGGAYWPLAFEPSATFGGGVGTRPWWLALLACGGAYWPLALEPSATFGGGVGTRPWWLALLACGGAYWPLAFEPSATFGEGGVGTRPWWLALLACGGAYWPLAFEPSATFGEGGVGTRPWWLALLACGGAYWPLAFEPSAMTSRRPYYCGHPHCRGHPPCGGGGEAYRLKEYAGWYSGVCVRAPLLRRGSSICGWVCWLPARWVGGERGGVKGEGGEGARNPDSQQSPVSHWGICVVWSHEVSAPAQVGRTFVMAGALSLKLFWGGGGGVALRRM